MASAKTNTFYIREVFDIDATPGTTTMDLSLYVDPVNRQGLLVRECDFIFHDKTTQLPANFTGECQAAVQLHDSILGGMASLDSPHQVASGSITGYSTTASTVGEDFFPDRLGMTKGDGRIVVNDTLEIATDANGTVPGDFAVCVVLECQVVRLTEKDYIALALQSVADA